MINSLLKYKIIDAVSMGASITSSAFNSQFLNDIAVQMVFTGTPTGTFTLEGSIDHAEQNGVVTNAGTWTTIALDAMPASGAAGNILVNLTNIAFPWIRIVYTRVSSTGTLNAYISAKAQG